MSEPQKAFQNLADYLSQMIIGQPLLINRLLIALLADGHLLVEGAPGLAKTRAVKTLANCIHGDFHRIQFTPDLLPADVTGTEVYRPEEGSFTFRPGPIFHHVLLADEINRAPGKVQSALLEAMEERQVTVGANTWPLADFFLVMATQNPLEQEGTFLLPEAQLDRFLMQVRIDYPDVEAELKILQAVRQQASQPPEPIPQLLHQEQIFAARQQVLAIYLAPELEYYVVQLVAATRKPENYDEQAAAWLSYGASPRGTLALDRCARAHAWLAGRDFVTPEDIHAVFYDTLRHRIILSLEAEATQVRADQVLARLLAQVPVP